MVVSTRAHLHTTSSYCHITHSSGTCRYLATAPSSPMSRATEMAEVLYPQDQLQNRGNMLLIEPSICKEQGYKDSSQILN